MTLGHPLVDAAIADLRLTPVDLNVFRVLWCQLDFEHFTEKKADVLALEVGCDRSYANASLRKMVEIGYVELGERSAKGVGTYRLPRHAPARGDTFTRSAISRRARRQVRDSL
ncbi:MAG: hypothetical protein KF709_02670 [Gemmatimonadaceae bacterium]|nr:hypothetical protein [Gemmatimonadaceae bacterium]